MAQENTYITYRATSIPQKMHVELLREKIYTMAEMMVFYSNKYADKRCLGYRDLLEESSEVQGTGKVFIKVPLVQCFCFRLILQVFLY